MAKKPRRNEFLNTLIEMAMKRNSLTSLQAVADGCGIPYSTLSGWKNGNSQAYAENIEKLLRFSGILAGKAGSEIHESEAVYEREPSVLLAGSVTSSNVEMDAENPTEISFSSLWSGSPWAQYTDASQPVMFLRVQGNEMAPGYPDRSYIVVRAALDGDIPDGAPCVIKTGQKLTFQVLVSNDDGSRVGLPMGGGAVSQPDLPVRYIALGVIQPRVAPTITFEPPAVGRRG